MVSKLVILGPIVVIALIAGAGYFLVKSFPDVPVEFLFTGGPGGCNGVQCEQFCQQNPKECQKWCVENPDACSKILGTGTGEIVEPPDTVIIFAKTLNLNADQFTKEDILSAKEMGANMVTIWPAVIVTNDEFIFFPERTADMINFAHQNGLQVELRSSFGGGAAEDYQKFKTNALEHVARYAEFGEKHKVYRIVPFGEVDNHFINHPDKITEFSQEMLQEMRKHYSGQIGTGVVAPWRDSDFIFNGYDYLTVSVYPQTQTGVDAWLTTEPEINLIDTVDWAREVADRSGILILHIGETGVMNIGEKDPMGFFQTAEVSKEKEAEFYDNVFNLVANKVDGVSAFYNSKTRFLGINGEPAEATVKEWYGKL